MDPFFDPAPPGPPSPLYGWDGTNWVAVEVNADGTVSVRGEDQLFSYKGQYMERVLEGDADAGQNVVDGSAVPAGEVWVVTKVTAVDLTSAIDMIWLTVNDGVTEHHVEIGHAPAEDELVAADGPVYLVEGDNMRATFQGCIVGDVLALYCFGHKMTLET